MDDDADCVEHVFELTEVVIGRGADLVDTCTRCGAVSVEPSQATDRARPPLGG